MGALLRLDAVVWDLPHQHHAHSQVRIMEQVGGGELSSQASSLERRLTRDLGGEKEQASSRNSSSLMAGGQRPAGSGRGLDIMAAMTQPLHPRVQHDDQQAGPAPAASPVWEHVQAAVLQSRLQQHTFQTCSV